MPHHRSAAAITAALDDLNAASTIVPRGDLERMVLAMIELVARSTMDADLAELLG